MKPVDFQKIFETSPGLFVVLRPDFSIVAVSDEYLKAAKATREKILGKNFFEVFPDNSNKSDTTSARPLQSSLEKVLSSRASDTMEARKYDIPRPEKEGGGFDVKYWKSINAPVMSENGEVEYVIRRVEDVTTLIYQEGERQALRQERDLFFSHSFDLMGIVGTDGYFKHLNSAFEKALGYSEEELCSKPVVEFLHPDDVATTKKRIQKLAAGSPTISSINRYRCKDGAYKWFSWNTTPMGPLLYAIGRDITEQVRSEEIIRQLNIELGRKNEDLELKISERIVDLRQSEAQVQQLQKMDAIGRLAGGIAHDFNNMLSALSIYCELLIDNAGKPETVRQHTQDIMSVMTSATALTRQLLIFSRKQIVQLQTINLNPLIQQLETMLTRLIGENIKIVKNFSADLKSVNVDPSQMEQVILNLVVNAKDAMPQGGVITLETSNVFLDETFSSTHLSVNRGHYVQLSIADNGLGMDADTVSKIFEPFFTTKPIGKGTGLGLTTTYGIIKQSKGTIWVYSEPGNGTVFKIYFPVAEQVAEEVETVASNLSALTGTETILLVEDDDKLRVGFSMMLQKKGYKVLIAANGIEALELCKTYDGIIHLLLTDMVMPGLSGFETAKKAVVLREDLRVLYMSGYTNDALENSGIESSAQLDFIQKPFCTSALIAKVQEVLFQSPRR